MSLAIVKIISTNASIPWHVKIASQATAEEALTYASIHKLVKHVSQESVKEDFRSVSKRKHVKAASQETAREGLLHASIPRTVMLVGPTNAPGVSELALKSRNAKIANLNPV